MINKHQIIMMVCLIVYTALHTSPARPAVNFNDGNYIAWLIAGVVCVIVALQQCKR